MANARETVVLVPEWKVPLIECRCGHKYCLIAHFPKKLDDYGSVVSESQAVDQAVCKFCPYCGEGAS